VGDTAPGFTAVRPAQIFQFLRIIAALGVLALIHIPPARGQAQRQFDVAAIKLNRSANTTSCEHASYGTLTVTNDSLKDLVKFAYDIKDFQITGGPRWFDTERYDIVAKAISPADISDNDLKSFLRSLLADRYKLRVHSEKREVTAYSLVIAKKGPKLTEHSGTGEFSSTSSPTSLRATKATTAALSASLSRFLGRPVADKTGLKGEYDYKLEWESAQQPDSSAPSIFSALQDQLGLKLETTRAPVDILVIDGAERPSEN
jgi:uncharacterized protein (TIGR03435 family)